MPVPEAHHPFPGKMILKSPDDNPQFSEWFRPFSTQTEPQILTKLDEISEKLDRLLNPHTWGPPCSKCRRDLYQFNGRWICLYCGE